MNELLVELRDKLGIKQSEFAKSIGLSQSGYSLIENGKRELNDRICKLISSEYNVSEEWLKTGSGEMFNSTQNNELLDLQKKYNLDQLDVKILQEYLKLSSEQRKIFRGYFVNVFGGSIADESEKIDLKVDAYRKELEDESRFSTSGASPNTDDAKKEVG